MAETGCKLSLCRKIYTLVPKSTLFLGSFCLNEWAKKERENQAESWPSLKVTLLEQMRSLATYITWVKIIRYKDSSLRALSWVVKLLMVTTEFTSPHHSTSFT